VPTQDELLKALHGHLSRVAESVDPSAALEPDAWADAARLARLLRDDVSGGDPWAWYLLGLFHWRRFLALPEGQDGDDLDAAIRAMTPCFIAGLDVHDAIGQEPGLGDGRREQILPGDAPQHPASGPRRDARGE